jgi:2-polyprenyl-3-methyl-5-hydroxy-6-metoxy-1,4-benzoquinol methylase
VKKVLSTSEADDFKEIHVWSNESLQTTELDDAFLIKYFKTLKEEDAVLDIGCGQGKLVKALRQRGYEVLGIDLNNELIEAALSENLPVKHLDVLEALQRELSHYNVFSMLDFVEHIPLTVFVSILKTISEKPGATVWIQTPNLDSVMGIKFWFQVPSHISPINPHVLHKLLDRLGFDVVEEWTAYGELPWKGLRRRLTLKILNGLFGAPMAGMFLGGANICLIARARRNLNSSV